MSFLSTSSLSIYTPLIYSSYFCPSTPTTTPRWLMDPAPPQPTEQPPPASSQGAPSMGKHRLSAAISFLNQQIQLIQDELDELETIGGVSAVCPELVSSIDSVPDALLPVSRGPAEVGWDRWFQGAHTSGNRRRWI